jgi:ABC-type amino acid transport substrate-binding protein
MFAMARGSEGQRQGSGLAPAARLAVLAWAMLAAAAGGCLAAAPATSASAAVAATTPPSAAVGAVVGLAESDRLPSVLTPAQQAWLQRQGPVRLAAEPDYGPFIFLAAPEPGLRGLSMDMLVEVQRRTGLQWRLLEPAPLATLLGWMRSGRADLITSLRRTPERSAYLLFSQPYVRVPAIVLVRADRLPPRVPVGHPLSALAGQAVAVGAGYAVEAVVRQAYPGVAWHSVPDDVVALQGVASGRFDAAVVDAASAAFVQQRHQVLGLRSAGEVGFEYELSFAVRRDRPELLAVLNEGIRAIPAADRRALMQRWLAPLDPGVQAPRAPWATRLALLLLCVSLLLAAALVWQHAKRAAP